MRRIVSSPQFDKKLIKFLKKNPDLDGKINSVFRTLEKDVRHPALKTHKLHGILNKFYACTITFQHRLVFDYDQDCVYPHTIGSHDDVY